MDPKHPFHLYLSSLPELAPSAPSWSASELQPLESTNLGVAAASSHASLAAQCERWLPALQAGHPDLFPPSTAASVHWAHSMYNSRRFPPSLLGPASSASHEPGEGVLLPVIDVLNHKPFSPVSWSSEDGTLSLKLGADIGPGEEVFHDYGRKGNEQLIMR